MTDPDPTPFQSAWRCFLHHWGRNAPLIQTRGALREAIATYLRAQASVYGPGSMTDCEEFLHRLAAELEKEDQL